MFTNKKFCEKRVIFFAVLCFLMSALETAIPKPLPFFRIGLANLPLVLALPVMGRREYFFLALLKVLSQGLVSGTIFSYVFIFSVSGTFASSFVMYFLHSVCSRKIISFVGISLMGALFNNGAQIILAWFLLFGSGIKYAIPFMLLVTLVCSAALGIFACVFEKKSLWYKEILESTDYGKINYSITQKNNSVWQYVIAAVFVCGFVFICFTDSLIFVYSLGAVFLFASLLLRKKIRILPSFILIFTMTLISLFSPYGKVLWNFGKFSVTQGALFSGLMKSGRLCAMVFASQCMCSVRINFPGAAGRYAAGMSHYLPLLLEKKEIITRENFFSMIDSTLVDAWRS